MPDRPLIEQNFTQFALTVGVVATPIGPAFSQAAMIDSFVVCLPAAAANEIYFGDESVTVKTGLEIGIGLSVTFATDNLRQLYELQNAILRFFSLWIRQSVMADMIPFAVWNLSRCFLVATAPTTARIIIFRSPYQ